MIFEFFILHPPEGTSPMPVPEIFPSHPVSPGFSWLFGKYDNLITAVQRLIGAVETGFTGPLQLVPKECSVGSGCGPE
jgi:hypothetical protein